MLDLVYKRGKKAQMQLSFGMIFTIILIAIFIAFAIFGITTFLKSNSEIQINQFLDALQEDITDAYKSTQSGREEEYFAPKGVDEICFEEAPSGNLYLIGENMLRQENLNNLDVSKTVQGGKDGKLCIEPKNGKIKLFIKKEFGENVVIQKQ